MRARLILVLALGLMALPAHALASTHEFLTTVATGTPAVGSTGTVPFDDACGVAVDNLGNTYVSDYDNRKVSVFGAAGFQFSIPSSKPENSPCDLAVDSESHVYGNYLHQGVVELLSAVTVDPGRSTGVSVNPLDNRLYVAHRTHVSVYESDGTPVPLTIGAGSLGDAYGVAVSGVAGTEGFVYVGDASDNTVKVFDPAADPTTPVAVIDGSETPPGGFRDLVDTDLSVDPVSGDVFVVDDLQPGLEHRDSAVYEFDPSGTLVSQISHWIEEIPPPPNSESPPLFFNRSLIHGRPSGVAVDPSGNVLVTSGNEEGAVLYEFGPKLVPTSLLRVATSGTGTGTVSSEYSGLSAPPLPPETEEGGLPPPPLIPASSPFSGINCGVICQGEFETLAVGQPFPFLTAAASPNSVFTGWSGDCVGTGICTPTLGGTVEVTANFDAIPQRTLTVSKLGTGEGLVSSSPVGVDCGATCSAEFDQGTQVNLSAEEVPGSEFAGWSGACSGTGACQVSLGEDRTVSATFNPVPPPTAGDSSTTPRRLAIVVGGTGAGSIVSNPAGIDCGTPCSAVYLPGTVITLTAAPDAESHFSGWHGCDSVSGLRCTVRMDTSKTLEAGFDEGPAIDLGPAKVKGAAGSIAVTVPGPGVMKASGKLLAPTKANSKRAGTVKLPLALSKAGKRALAKKGRVSTTLSVTFTPSGGGPPAVVSKSVTFKKGNK